MDRRRFVQSVMAVGAASAVRPPLLWGQGADALRDLADAALATARKAGATYADIRINRYRNQFLFTRDRRVDNIVDTEDYGFGVRVIVDGTWGFASSSLVSKEEIARIASQAVAIARANRAINAEQVRLAPVPAYDATWNTPVKRNPFDVPLQAKLDLLLQVHEEALKVPGASFVSASMQFVNEQKYFASTEGSHIEQSLIRTYPSFNVTSVDKTTGRFYSRRALTSPMGMGYEYVESYPLLQEARVAAEEAVATHKAKPAPAGSKALILHPSNLWLTIHESVGHSTELDRALGYEANLAGTSFLTTDKLGTFTFGSPIVNLVADKTQEHGMATCGYDDDGVKTTRWHLVKDGTFVDYQTTRDQAALIGQSASHGCSYADSWGSVPFQRMPNVSLEPGTRDLSEADIIGATEDGVYVKGDGSYSIDHQRYNFQFSGQTFWEVKKGKITTQLRDLAYQSNTPEFWKACDLLGGRSTYQLGGAFTDGKGQPMQINSVSHGCPIARFAGVTILNTGR
ncbi:TldD/PmbA family protein [Luteitalea sp. TBR-22]|uniref:TldD/PmbA family protein n=1 Tax=Luteitalea sp. TBR-22 TaxID=2802971 RepID=UPI00351D4C10